jgi:hypothetical protein
MVFAVSLSTGFAVPALAEAVYGVTEAGFLVNWESATPGTIIAGVPLQGLQSNEQIVGIEFRPTTGELFGLGSFSRIYSINPASGQASPVSGAGFSPTLNGASFGFDFNPTVDRIRMVSDADQNLRANPITGMIAATDPSLVYAAGDVREGVNPNVSHVAYTNSVPGATTTTLYGMDAGTDSLVRHTVGPGFAQLVTVGGIGTDITEQGGFDISGPTGVAFATVQDSTLARSTFWTIDLNTGAGSMVGEVGGGHMITAMAVVPEPASFALLVIGALMLRRR